MKLKLALIMIILIFPIVNAGSGIVYDSEIVNLPEEATSCIEYKVYNPWDRPTNIKVSARGDLESIVLDSKTIPVEANVFHEEAIPLELCFKIPDLYEEDCLFWKIGCKRECNEEKVEYKGDVVALELSDSSSSGTGSQITGAVTAPLTIEAKCEAQDRDYLSILGVVGMIIFSIVSVLIWNNSRAPPEERKKKKAERLRKKEKELQRKLKKL